MTIEPWKHRTPSWEPVDHSNVGHDVYDVYVGTSRLAVLGGWVYKVTEWNNRNLAIAVCFVPVVENVRTD